MLVILKVDCIIIISTRKIVHALASVSKYLSLIYFTM